MAFSEIGRVLLAPMFVFIFLLDPFPLFSDGFMRPFWWVAVVSFPLAIIFLAIGLLIELPSGTWKWIEETFPLAVAMGLIYWLFFVGGVL